MEVGGTIYLNMEDLSVLLYERYVEHLISGLDVCDSIVPGKKDISNLHIVTLQRQMCFSQLFFTIKFRVAP